MACMGLATLCGCAGGGEDDPTSGPENGGGTPPPEATVNFSIGDKVAELELAAPSESPFLIRGTIPIAAGMYLPSSSSSPFKLRVPGVGFVNTQVEVVSRYPAAEEGADVVEILAKVEVPAGTNPGDRVAYNVVWSPNTSGSITVDCNVQSLLATQDALVVRATDVFGHLYEADLLYDLINATPELHTYRDGHIARQVRTYENLTPVTPAGGATGTLPHMMGAHAYITTWTEEEFISLDLRFHNGHQGLDPGTDQDNPVGKLYFNELELRVPSGWTVFQAFESPSLGTTYTEGANRVLPLVDPIAGPKMHVMPIQAQFHRRLVVCRSGAEDRARAVLREEWLAFCRDGENSNEERLLSWWNPGSARYWSQNLPLPTLDQLGTKDNIRGEVEVKFDTYEQVLLNGTTGPFPLNSGNLGWSHPWGLDIGYMHGGDEILWWDGLEALWTASTEGYRNFQISHRMYTERHATALYDTSGDAYKYEDWLVEGPTQTYLPTYIYFIPWFSLADLHGFTTADSFQVDAVAAQSRQPGYEATLLTYKWIDEAHLIRYTRSPKVLAWAGNDALSKDDLRLQAELCRTSYAPYPQKDNGESIVTGFTHDTFNVEENPGEGVYVDRTEGWGFDTVAAYYALADDDWRGLAEAWAEEIIDFFLLGQDDCSGFIMTYPSIDHIGGEYRLVQSISEAIITNGLWGMRTSMFDSRDEVYADRLNELILGSVQGMNGPKVWDPGGSTFHFYTAVGPYDQDLPPFCNYVPDGGHLYSDNWQTWNFLLFGYLLTGDELYINRAGLMGGSTNPDVIGGDAWSGELEVRAGMVALLQNL